LISELEHRLKHDVRCLASLIESHPRLHAFSLSWHDRSQRPH
jgi:hypothetical protein